MFFFFFFFFFFFLFGVRCVRVLLLSMVGRGLLCVDASVCYCGLMLQCVISACLLLLVIGCCDWFVICCWLQCGCACSVLSFVVVFCRCVLL